MENKHLSSSQPCYIFWVIAPPGATSDKPLFLQKHSNLQPDLGAMLISRQSLLVGMHAVYHCRSPFVQQYWQLSYRKLEDN